MDKPTALIFAADHNAAVSASVVRPLSNLGHKVITAPDVASARAWLEDSADTPDLFIVDVGLRAFGGLEFIQFLKADSRWEHIPILVQSRSVTLDFYQFCEGILMKPYSPVELTRQVGLMLSGAMK